MLLYFTSELASDKNFIFFFPSALFRPGFLICDLGNFIQLLRTLIFHP